MHSGLTWLAEVANLLSIKVAVRLLVFLYLFLGEKKNNRKAGRFADRYRGADYINAIVKHTVWPSKSCALGVGITASLS